MIKKPVKKRVVKTVEESVIDKYSIYYDNGSSYDILRSLANCIYGTGLEHTCSMTELSFDGSDLEHEFLENLTKEEFEYILFKIRDIGSSVITNVINNEYYDAILKDYGYTPVSQYKGNDGTINTYIFVNPSKVIKTRVKK